MAALAGSDSFDGAVLGTTNLVQLHERRKEKIKNKKRKINQSRKLGGGAEVDNRFWNHNGRHTQQSLQITAQHSPSDWTERHDVGQTRDAHSDEKQSMWVWGVKATLWEVRARRPVSSINKDASDSMIHRTPCEI